MIKIKLKQFFNWIKSKLDTTVFGDAINGFRYMWKKNIGGFSLEIIISLILSIIITGFLVLTFFNLGGEGYAITLWNIFAAWLTKGILFSLVVFVVLQIFVGRFIKRFSLNYLHDDERMFDKSKDNTYGSADEMTLEEMKNTFVMAPLKDNKCTILGCDPKNEDIIIGQKHPIRKLNRNMLMIAGPSAGKSATFIIPLILQIMRRGESAIISDPKSELFRYLSELAKKLGYIVRIMNLNPMFLDNSDACNFLKYVGNDVDKAQVMSSAIISNTTGGSAMFDFWTEGADNLLQAAMLFINYGNTFTPSQKNLPMIFRWLTENTLESIDNIFNNLPDDHPAKTPASIFTGGEEKVKKQTLQGLRIKLKLFNSPKLKKILSRTEGNIDMLDPGRKKCLYFVGSNDQDSSMSPIVSLFYTIEYQELVRYADMRNTQELPITVHMVLDEYANMPSIPDFEKKLSTVRSRNIVTYIVVQDINQLKTKHPYDTHKTVINDCDYFMCLKTNDPDTMEWFSRMSGDMTVSVKNTKHDKTKLDIVDLHIEESVTEGSGKRNVYTEHEIRTLGDDECLLVVSQRNPIKLHTFYWKRHPYAKHVVEVLPVQHYPFWRLIDDGIVTEDFDYDHEPSFVIELPEDEQIDIDKSYDPDKMLKAFSNNKKASHNPLQLISKNAKKAVQQEHNDDTPNINMIKAKENSKTDIAAQGENKSSKGNSNNLFEERKAPGTSNTVEIQEAQFSNISVSEPKTCLENDNEENSDSTGDLFDNITFEEW